MNTKVSIPDVIMYCILTFFVTLIIFTPIASCEGYRKAEVEHRDPAYPMKQIEYLPPDHNMVYLDAKKFYWVEPKGYNPRDLTLNDCKACHGDRWNQLGGWSTAQKLEYWNAGTRYIQNLDKRSYEERPQDDAYRSRSETGVLETSGQGATP